MSIYLVLIPVAVLISVILISKIPYIGGNIHVAMVLAGLVAMLLGELYAPTTWLVAWLDGLDRISWVIMISIFGTIYAQTQIALGTMETVIDVSRAGFGRSPRGLLIAIMASMIVAGSLLGDSIAVATVIGVLVVTPLADMGLEPEEISATLVMGAILGSICPPISSVLYQTAGLMNVSPQDVVQISYVTVLLAGAISCGYAAFRFVHIKSLPAELLPKEGVAQILKKRWKTLVPMGVLIVLVVLRACPLALDLVTLAFKPLISYIQNVPILKGLTNPTCLAIVVVSILSFAFGSVRRVGASHILKQAWKSVLPCTGIQLAAGFMLGCFYASGMIDTVQKFAVQLPPNALVIGGVAAMLLMGMLTGSAVTVTSTILSFLGPALVAVGFDAVHVAAAAAHFASGAQTMPPTDLTTFVVAGLVGGILGVKVNTVKSMFKSLPGFVVLMVTGLVLLYM